MLHARAFCEARKFLTLVTIPYLITVGYYG
jgi:hypothetical protein